MGKNRVKKSELPFEGKKKSHNFDWIFGENPSASIGRITLSVYR